MLQSAILYLLFFQPSKIYKKQAVIANGVQRNEAICSVLAEILLKLADCFVVPPRNDNFGLAESSVLKY